MKRALRLVCFILVFSIMLNNITVATAYSDSTTLKVSLGTAFSNKSTEVKIPVQLSNLPSSGVSGASFVLQFDEGLVFNYLEPGTIISNSKDISYSIKDNKIYILFSDSTGGDKPIKTEGVFCYLSFKVSASAYKNSYSIRKVYSGSEMFVDNYLNSVEVNYTEGTILLKEKLYSVQPYKIWRVTFNKEINPITVNNTNIDIRDINGQKINCNFELINGGKTLVIFPPAQEYEVNNSYTITFKQTLTSKEGRKLTEEQNIFFYVNK